MEDNQFYIRIWTLVVSVIITLIASLCVSSVTSDYHIRLLIEQGVDPIAANCAIAGPKGVEGSKLLLCEKAIGAQRLK